jgi:hypothetical protein
VSKSFRIAGDELNMQWPMNCEDVSEWRLWGELKVSLNGIVEILRMAVIMQMIGEV